MPLLHQLTRRYPKLPPQMIQTLLDHKRRDQRDFDLYAEVRPLLDELSWLLEYGKRLEARILHSPYLDDKAKPVLVAAVWEELNSLVSNDLGIHKPQ